MKVYLATDHGGFELKNKLVEYVRELGYESQDCGAFVNDPQDDYPELIAEASRKLSADSLAGIDSRAIIIGASGQGEAMVANRFKGVRCALYYGPAGKEQKDMSGKSLDMLASSREHNNANCLSVGARFLSEEEVKDAVKKWLSMAFPGEERHTRRIKQIDEVA
ncbi:RpiB/LacA/LacB family sugar-phosphate isomerase [Candidatus Kaiserbacteria bacterium]|nr:RpiB/LacA/LacB family sugar-phosphate isomerase [Candidatus Kaiserbacteria bacterium]